MLALSTDNIECRSQGEQAASVNSAVRGSEAEAAAKRGWQSSRTRGVRSQTNVAHARCHRNRRSGGGTARNTRRRDRVDGCAFVFVFSAQAVRQLHYLTHGRSIAATRKALGFPCRQTLADWIDELHPDATRRLVGRARSVPRPAEVKSAAVIELCTRQGSAKEVAEQMGVSRPTLYNWKNQLLGREAPASMKRPADLPPEPQRVELERQREWPNLWASSMRAGEPSEVVHIGVVVLFVQIGVLCA